MSLTILSLCFILIRAVIVNCDVLMVETESGMVKGKFVEDDIVTYYCYQGIPYAEPPTGSLRFMPPVPKKAWSGILNAIKEGAVCTQTNIIYKYSQMSEDCLFVNIYVPAPRSTELLPVVFFVHGGQFQFHSGNMDKIHGPQFLLKKNVIVVTVNFRVGALGFLSLNVPEASGNAAIKDVLLAIKWVKVNIKNFGGDPEKITVAGNSGGAMLLHSLMLSEKCAGLFQRAILLSGSAFPFYSKDPIKYAKALAQDLGLNTTNVTRLAKELKQVNSLDIVKSQIKLMNNKAVKGKFNIPMFMPSIEAPSDHAILTEHPFKHYHSQKPHNVSILMGLSSKEGIFLTLLLQDNSTDVMDKMNQNSEEFLLPFDLENSPNSKTLANKIKQFYFGNESIEYGKDIEKIVELNGDILINYGVDAWIRRYKASKDSSTVFYYVLDFDGELNWFKLINNVTYNGTSHADELGYIFVTEATRDRLHTVDSRSKQMLETVITYLTNFIKFGTPTPVNEPGDKWLDCGPQRHYMLLNENPTFQTETPFAKRMDFWDEIYSEYYSNFES